MRTLVFGDLHLDDKYPGYLNTQISTVIKIVSKESPDDVVFLGDVFHYRKPTPEVLLGLKRLLDSIPCYVHIVRGNHDSSTKADDGVTALTLFENKNVFVATHNCFFPNNNFYFIPHYENEEKIVDKLQDINIKPTTITFGHFGYQGSLNSAGDMDFNITMKNLRRNPIFLGHIHKHSVDGNVTVLGTPWSTSFAECDYNHYYAVIEGDPYTDRKITYKKIESGIRYLVYPYEALEANKTTIKDVSYYTVLRVLLSRFDNINTVDLRKQILEDYKCAYVDLKFIPTLKNKFDRLSNFETTETITEINDDLIDSYLEENQSQIPNVDLKVVLEEVRNAVKNTNTK